jgi:hypothetical protein
MYVETITITRPDTTAEFWNLSTGEPDGWQALIDEGIRQNKILEFSDTVVDPLTYVRIFKYPTEANHDEVQAAFIDLLFNSLYARNTYEAAHGHVRITIFTTEPDVEIFEHKIRLKTGGAPFDPNPPPPVTPPTPAPVAKVSSKSLKKVTSKPVDKSKTT